VIFSFSVSLLFVCSLPVETCFYGLNVGISWPSSQSAKDTIGRLGSELCSGWNCRGEEWHHQVERSFL
jgi:hypothetical protein